MPNTSGTKTRRTHTKSRNGCFRCKRLRKKCDELTPRCTRCTDLDQVCRYPTPTTEDLEVQPLSSVLSTTYLDVPSVFQQSGHEQHQQQHLQPFHTFSGDDPLSSSDHTNWSSPDTSLNNHLDTNNVQGLDSRDLELLSHYLSHTSRTIPIDSNDLYALHVGAPNLAFKSKPLMSTILALAATCQCQDLLMLQQQSGNDDDDENLDLTEVQALLERAEQHHTTSLRLTNGDETLFATADKFDYVLANAVLMVLYGSASHCVRIQITERLLRRSKSDMMPMMMMMPREFVPTHSRWISMIRAVHVAYLGLLNNSGTAAVEAEEQKHSPATDGEEEHHHLAVSSPSLGVIGQPEDGPSPHTRALFLPIVAETALGAMQKLATSIHVASTQLVDHDADDLPACWEAFLVLETTMKAVFPAKFDVDGTAVQFALAQQHQHHQQQQQPPKLPSHIAPWLRTYLTSVTSYRDMVTAPLRRNVVFFLNKVPETYMRLVQATLDQMPSSGSSSGVHEHCSVAHRLAMDIFAHWLVLQMLLDGVWWMGGIGFWELGKVVGFMKSEGDEDHEADEAWWPESMYNIRKSLRQQGI